MASSLSGSRVYRGCPAWTHPCDLVSRTRRGQSAKSQCVGRGACGCRGEVRGRYNYLKTPTHLFDLVAFAFRSTQVNLAPFLALLRSQVSIVVDRQLVHVTSLSSSCRTGFRYPAIDVQKKTNCHPLLNVSTDYGGGCGKCVVQVPGSVRLFQTRIREV